MDLCVMATTYSSWRCGKAPVKRLKVNIDSPGSDVDELVRMRIVCATSVPKMDKTKSGHYVVYRNH